MVSSFDTLRDRLSSLVMSSVIAVRVGQTYIPDEYKSSAVYEFSCPGCRSSYIGKTDRCLYTRIKEHSTRENSEIYAHVNSCEYLQHIKSLWNSCLTYLTLYVQTYHKLSLTIVK